MEKIFNRINTFLINMLVFSFPLFLFNFTQEYFITAKFYLLGLFALIFISLTAIRLIVLKKAAWTNKPTDLPVVLPLISLIAAVIFSPTNKVQAILNPISGLAVILFLTILYFYFSRGKKIQPTVFIVLSGVLSLVSILFFFRPFTNLTLPIPLQFLKNPAFSPLGSPLDSILYLGFFLVMFLFSFKDADRKNKSILYVSSFFGLLALGLTVFSVFKDPVVLPPIRTSWYAALETMKTAKTAIFGIGIDNFSVAFTRVKDLAYNQSPLWQIASFNSSRSAVLHILTETGIFGAAAFLLLIFSGIKTSLVNPDRKYLALLVYLAIWAVFMVPSLPLFFLLFFAFSQIGTNSQNQTHEIDLKQLPLFYVGAFIVLLGVVGGGGYLLSRSLMSEYYYKRALDFINENRGNEAYENMRLSRIANPYSEKVAMSFSNLNMLIANNLAEKTGEKSTDQDRQVISQAIQSAISEAKNLIILNPNKAQYYENLAGIYRNIINVAQGADTWAVSAMQRAVVLDPANPSYRFGMGGLYYLLGKYPDSAGFFGQAASLKPDWANAYFNLAWAYYQNNEFDKATLNMKNVLNLLENDKTSKEWEKANQDLEVFKNKLDAANEATDEGSLSLPKAPSAIDPKIELPKEASPEAN